jgi:cysteine synthase A
MIYDEISHTIGNTPLLRLRKISPPDGALIAGKLEFFNPSSSVKDRIAKHMIDCAESRGTLKKGGVIIEPTSGNTGIGLAMIAASRGYKLIVTMPESMSIERRNIIEHFGAEIVLTPAEKGMNGAVEKALELLEKNPGAFMPRQFENPDNPEIHESTTAEEIWKDTAGSVDIFVAGVGTGGTITGVGRVFKKRKKTVQVIAVEPASSAVISGHPAGKHEIQGIGAGFIPKNFDKSVVDEIITVSNDDAIVMAKRLAVEEGIFCGISSGANVHASLQTAQRPENAGKLIVTIICDTAERYLTTRLFDKIRKNYEKKQTQ